MSDNVESTGDWLLATRSQTGFTLMEVLVVLAVFSTISVAVTDLFMISTRAERRIGTEERMQADARTAIEQMARTMRGAAVAYDKLASPVPWPVDRLPLRLANGTLVEYYLSSNAAECGASPAPCLMIREDENPARAAALSTAGLTVTNLKFFIAPAQDPYAIAGGAYAADDSPRVTFVIKVAPTAAPGQSVTVQSTVTTRQYVR